MSGKVALITGGARGLGRQHAIRLAEEGADIVVLDVCRQAPEVPYPLASGEDLEETRRLVADTGRKCLAFEADASDFDAVKQVVETAVEEFGHLDTVVINHGVCVPHGLDEDNTDEIFDFTVKTNLNAVWRVARAAVPALKATGTGGSIVIIASAAGLSASPGIPSYVASKHGVIGLGKALAIELASDWIRVNVVCPGNVATPMAHNPFILSLVTGGKADATPEDATFTYTAMNLLPQPWVEPRVVSEAVLWLASNEAKAVTGVALPVDLGMTTQPGGITAYIGAALAGGQ